VDVLYPIFSEHPKRNRVTHKKTESSY